MNMDGGELFIYLTAILFFFFLFGVCLLGTVAMLITGHIPGAIITFLFGSAALVGIAEMMKT
jgi:hypothetical protein